MENNKFIEEYTLKTNSGLIKFRKDSDHLELFDEVFEYELKFFNDWRKHYHIWTNNGYVSNRFDYTKSC
jgi:hypothetical protein